jgi:hypothetical protein
MHRGCGVYQRRLTSPQTSFHPGGPLLCNKCYTEENNYTLGTISIPSIRTHRLMELLDLPNELLLAVIVRIGGFNLLPCRLVRIRSQPEVRS